MDSATATDSTTNRSGSPLPSRIRDGSATLDITGSAPQQTGPLNATRATTLAAIAVVVKSLIDPRILVNDGLYRCMEGGGTR